MVPLLKSLISAACAALLIVTLPVAVPAEAPLTELLLESTQPSYNIPIPISAQDIIRHLGDEAHLSTEFIMAIFFHEGMSDFGLANLESEVNSLAVLRDYWVSQGYSHEAVFVLILLSRDRGIDGCLLFMAHNENADDDAYVQSVVRIKYELEQSIYSFDELYTLDQQISPRVY